MFYDSCSIYFYSSIYSSLNMSSLLYLSSGVLGGRSIWSSSVMRTSYKVVFSNENFYEIVFSNEDVP